MKFTQEQLNKFASIYLDSYGISLNPEEVEINLIEITQLLEEIIKINYRKNYEK